MIIPSISGENIKAIFTTRHGDPKKESILEKFVYQNSKKPDLILKRLQSGYPLKQIHSNSIYKFHNWFIGRQGDGMFTNRKFLPCVINVADCVQILIKNKNRNLCGPCRMERIKKWNNQKSCGYVFWSN